MKQQKGFVLTALMIVVPVLALAQAGCRDATGLLASYRNTAPAPARHDHREEPHAGVPTGKTGEHEKETPSLEEIAAVRCEHGIPTYTCDECRYELGVVKVPAGLMKDTSPDGEGLVRVEPVSRHEVSDGLPVTGEIRLNQNATVRISPRISGVIDSVEVDIGASVKKGETLLTLRSVALCEAINNYRRSRSLASLSKRVYEREKDLYERKITSEQDMIDARMEYEKNKTDEDAAEQTLRVIGLKKDDLAAIERDSFGVDREALHVHAPISGTILEKDAVVGEVAGVDRQLMLLSDLGTVWAWADIYERDLARLLEARQRGPIPVDVLVRAFPDRPFKGEIDYVGMVMDEKTRTVKVRAVVQNKDLSLRPGMFCEMRMEIAGGREAITVPDAAVLDDEGSRFVFLRWKDDYFVRRPVRTGRDLAGNLEIVEGLSRGDLIVTDGAFLLKSDVLRAKMGAGCAD